MKNNDRGDKMSLTELVKRLREQADALPDDDDAVAEEAEVRPDDDVFNELLEGKQPEPAFATPSARYRFRVTTRKKNAIHEEGSVAVKHKTAPEAEEASPAAETEEEPILVPLATEATAEVPAVVHTVEPIIEDVLDEELEDVDDEAAPALADADTRPIDPLPEIESIEEKTLEFESVDRVRTVKHSPSEAHYGKCAVPTDLEELSELSDLDALYEDEERERYIPHGAQARMQDTGDITYVYDNTEGAEVVPDEELVPPEVDETDVNLMIAFGMDDELAKTIGEGSKEKVERQLHDIEKEMEEEDEEENAFEYTSPAQNKQIFREYKKKYRKVTLKIAICAVLLLIAFLYENIAFFGGTLADAINPKLYPVTHIMLDLQLVLLGGALMWRRLYKGLTLLLKLKPIPDSVMTLLILVTAVYDVGMCFLPYGATLYLYGFPTLLGVMVGLVFELYNLKREIFSFNIVASKRIKFTIGRLEKDSAQLEQDAFRDYLPEDPNIFKLNKAAFVDGFYARMKPSGSNRRVLLLLIAFAFALTAALIGLGTVFTENLVSGITVGYASLMMCMPLAVYLTYSLPFYRASQIAYEQDSAILGEGAIDEYAEASSISFDDRDVFPSYGVKVRSIKVFGNHRIDNIIYHAASVFRIAGGPLSDVFDIATADLGHSEDVRLLSVENDGIEAVVSGTHLYFGKDEYLRRNHFAPLVDDDDGKVGNVSIMYMVSDDEVVAKMYIQYRIDPDFEATLKQLYRYGICVGIKTFDPNIDDEMLSRRIKLDKYPVRILKCREAEDHTKVLEHTESRLVSKHSAKALLKAFTLCSKVQRMIRTDVAINVISMLMGVVVMLLTLVFGVACEIPSFYIALYQLFWAVPMYLLAKMTIQ